MKENESDHVRWYHSEQTSHVGCGDAVKFNDLTRGSIITQKTDSSLQYGSSQDKLEARCVRRQAEVQVNRQRPFLCMYLIIFVGLRVACSLTLFSPTILPGVSLLVSQLCAFAHPCEFFFAQRRSIGHFRPCFS